MNTSNLKDLDDGKRLIKRPIFRTPLGITVPSAPSVIKNNKITYEDTVASSFYVTDSVHSVVHCFQHPMKGTRGFGTTKSNDVNVKRSYQWSFGVRGSLPGELCGPKGMATWKTKEEQGIEHIIIADSNNDRIQCFVHYTGGAGVHFQCMYPPCSDIQNNEMDNQNNQDAQDNNKDEEKKKKKEKDINKKSTETPSSLLNCNLLSPSDVSVRVVNGVVLIYVCDTGNHCIRIFTLSTEVIDSLDEENINSRTLSIGAFCKIPQHLQWMYSYRTKTNCYIRTKPKRTLLLIATWGGYGNAPGYFISPSSIDTFENIPKKHTEMEFSSLEGTAEMEFAPNPLGISVCICDPGNNRVQILKHSINLHHKGKATEKNNGGCCSIL